MVLCEKTNVKKVRANRKLNETQNSLKKIAQNNIRRRIKKQRFEGIVAFLTLFWVINFFVKSISCHSAKITNCVRFCGYVFTFFVQKLEFRSISVHFSPCYFVKV